MITDEMKEYPEFEEVDSMSPVEGASFLLKLAKRYSTVAELAKKYAYTLVKDMGEEYLTADDGTRMKCVTKTRPSVDVSALKECYPEVYKEICDSGEVSISVKAIKDKDVEGVTTITTSSYLELCR